MNKIMMQKMFSARLVLPEEPEKIMSVFGSSGETHNGSGHNFFQKNFYNYIYLKKIKYIFILKKILKFYPY
jgi:hypothetical protein